MRPAVLFAAVVGLLAAAAPSSAFLLPLLDRRSSQLSELFSDPLRVLEHIPFGLDRDDLTAAVTPVIASVDWKETPDAHQILIDVPGMKREELKIEVEENRILRVSGERKREEKKKKGEHWHCLERAEGWFWRQFRLPENVNIDGITAKIQDGVLTITLPKLAPDQVKGPRVVSIAGGEAAAESLSAGDGESKKVQL
ncbi:22.0 kDa class IV heat shock protein [Apostasia shenzhenica]|uniref:22.0 kDa class IV heat shock protein n=1 Tax=Apostasia shenzhenica TaxID=1088818 RepID=A0A2I0AKB5_9ASPA|nr:22.0 kDa class IV heat shock protein [Apostasia shenzhenica]